MCRLLGYVAERELTVADLVGSHLDDFRRLSRLHGDGWGAAWPCPEGMEVARSVTAAEDSEEFRRFASSHRTDTAFAHNGSIYPPEAVDPFIAPPLAGHRRGTTDSERYFLAVLSCLAETHDPGIALARTAAKLSAGASHTSLNAMLLTQHALYVVTSFTAASLADNEPDSFDLRYRLSDDAVVVASSGWPQPDWTPLRNGELLTVERDTLRTTVVPIAELVA
jgi:predicted glutamine amidotransferase